MSKRARWHVAIDGGVARCPFVRVTRR